MGHLFLYVARTLCFSVAARWVGQLSCISCALFLAQVPFQPQAGVLSFALRPLLGLILV